MHRNRLLFLLVVFVCLSSPIFAAETAFHEGWQLHTGCGLQEDGAKLSSVSYSAEGWLPTAVPATVLAAQVSAGQYPDPYFGNNLRKLPGMGYPVGRNFANLPMPEDSPYRCGWWYRKQFAARPEKGRRTWLHFGGINYRGELWVNGKLIAGKDAIAGAYRIYDFDVTDALQPGKDNVVALQVFAPTEKDLGINWVDWNPAPPDKDMGLWGAVSMVTTGDVVLNSPMVVTHFADNALRAADLTVYAEAQNATAEAKSAVIRGTVAGHPVEQKVQLAAHETRTVTFAPVHVTDPKPWWPKQMGEPHLEQLSLAVSVSGVKTDDKQISFGVREMTSELTGNGSRLFRVNGKPILIRGAGWSQDMLLRTDSQKLRDQMDLVQAMNLNTIRLEGKLEVDEFFRLADERGILVMLGWCCCDKWEQWSTWTDDDLKIASKSLQDQLLRLRSHASLLVWLNGSDNAPPPKVERAYLDVEAATHWPNPILSAASSQNTAVSGANGVKMTGPYDYVEPGYWYVDQRYGGAWGFNTETSPGPAIPSLASRKKFLSDPEAWPPTDDWRLHNGSGEFATLNVFDNAMAAIYGKPTSAAEYERMGQTLTYDSERAMFEAYTRSKYQATGVVQWMLNNAWPSMIWHLYDYYLDAGAGYFATRKACEPLHIQYAYDDRGIDVVNSTYAASGPLHAAVSVRDLAWKELYRNEQDVTLAADSVQQVTTVPVALYRSGQRILFLDLALRDSKGEEVSHNVYWVPTTLTSFDWYGTNYTHTPADRYEDLAALTRLPAAQVETHIALRNADKHTAKVTLRNPSSNLAFQVHVAARTAAGDLVAPVMWSDNWIEIAPGGTVVLTGVLPQSLPSDLVFEVEGWNVAHATLKAAE
ncbi:glycoside hydrolase family 2 protein [Terriglobus aquaticus]|uniref:Glycosyl hydrolase 2 galactose-binding domain-containing protein n=1 Tax=Terriglobus aquaticus TaxID=940139 RepID=A0ABW9KI15_9BACT|nr:glycosyl hydrolase family 2 [Terriglobus aquaticus]